MSVRKIRGRRLAARGLEEPDAKGPDAPAVSESGAARSAAEQQHNRPGAKLVRKRDPHRRVQEAPDEQQRRQPRDPPDGYEGGEQEKDEPGRPLGDDGFESLHAACPPPRGQADEPDGGAGAVEQIDDAFRARFGDAAPPPQPADLSSLPTAEYDLSSLQEEVRPDPPRLGMETLGLDVQIHEAVKSTLPASAPRTPPLSGVPLGASRPEGSRPRAQRVPPPPASTGFEALEILSQIVRGTAPDAAAPPVTAVTVPEMPIPSNAAPEAGDYPGVSVVMTPAEETGGTAPTPTSPTQVIPAIPSEGGEK